MNTKNIKGVFTMNKIQLINDIKEELNTLNHLNNATINIPVEQYQNETTIQLDFNNIGQIENVYFSLLDNHGDLTELPVQFQPQHIDASAESIAQFVLNNKSQFKDVIQMYNAFFVPEGI